MLFKKEIQISPEEAVEKLKENAIGYGFIVREVFDMAEEFSRHTNVSDDIVFYSVMLCNPKKAYASIAAKKERGALLLQPKQVTVYSQDGKTYVGYYSVEKDAVAEAYPDDLEFQDGLMSSCGKIMDLVDNI